MSSPCHRASPMVHPACAFEEPDADDFYEVHSHHRWHRQSPPKLARPIPSALVSLCFNCLANNHAKADCVFLVRCFNYRCEGHRTFACPLPPRPLAGKQGRSPSRTWGVHHVAPWRAAKRHWAPDVVKDTESTWCVSTGRSSSIPCYYAPLMPLPAASPQDAEVHGSPMVLDVPEVCGMAPGIDAMGSEVGCLARSCHTEFIIVPRSGEL